MHSAVREDVFLQSLALSVARNSVGPNVPIADVLVSEGVTESEYSNIAANPVFVQYLNKYTTELVESGFSFEAKCRVLAEDLLSTQYHMARDMDTPAPVRAKIMENLVDWGNLKPKTAAGAVGNGSGFSINIVLPGTDDPARSASTVVVDVTPDPVSEEVDSRPDPVSEETAPELAIPHTSTPIDEILPQELPVENFSAEKVVEFVNWVDDMEWGDE